MIVVEGLDGTGKTTLVNQLLEEFPVLKGRPSIGNKHDLDVIYEGAQQEAFTLPYNVITDRARIVSEYIYNPILNVRPLAFTFKEWMNFLGSFVQRSPHLLVFCHRHLGEVIDTWDHEGQLEGVREHLGEIDRMYEQVEDMYRYLFAVENRSSRVLTYNFKKIPYVYVSNAVRDYLKEA